MGNNNQINAVVFINIIVFVILYAFITRHIGAWFGAEQAIGILLALIPSGLTIFYYFRK